jgi:hypothetical protein
MSRTMSNRKHRDSQSLEPATAPQQVETRPTSPAESGKNPGRMMFVLWGIPLLLFIVVAFIKQCGG